MRSDCNTELMKADFGFDSLGFHGLIRICTNGTSTSSSFSSSAMISRVMALTCGGIGFFETDSMSVDIL